MLALAAADALNLIGGARARSQIVERPGGAIAAARLEGARSIEERLEKLKGTLVEHVRFADCARVC